MAEVAKDANVNTEAVKQAADDAVLSEAVHPGGEPVDTKSAAPAQDEAKPAAAEAGKASKEAGEKRKVEAANGETEANGEAQDAAPDAAPGEPAAEAAAEEPIEKAKAGSKKQKVAAPKAQKEPTRRSARGTRAHKEE